MLRRMMLGLVGVVAMCGAVAAKPPGLQPSPHAEGRELDPVTREYYLPESPATSEDSTPARGPTADDNCGALWAIMIGAHETIINEFTMQLGTVSPAGM